MTYLFYSNTFLFTVLLSFFLTWVTIKIAKYFKILDIPADDRKIHTGAMPLLGGCAVFLSFFLVLFFLRSHLLDQTMLRPSHYIGFFVGGLLIMLGGVLDDKYNLKPSWQFIFPVLAIVSVILGGVEIERVSSPFGGYFYLSYWSPILITLWLLGMMYTTKLLDGMDGLVSGVSGIGAIIIFLFTLTPHYFQPDISLASLVLAGSIFGFLLWNFHPAKIFLGEGGSLFLGYALGVLAIISGGKFAVALLIMGIPILDVCWTILRRLLGGQNPFRSADRKHLHHRLYDLGLGQRLTVLIFYTFSLVFGLSALFLQSRGKIMALIGLFVTMILIIVGFSLIDRKTLNSKN
ncbi:MAG: MraY family glycosyltransferase [bacterium]